MIRPFNLRDLPLVHRLSEHGVSLHMESALTKNLHPTRGALFSLVGGDFPTYVWKSDKNGLAGFIQLFLDEENVHAHILYLSSTAENNHVEGTDGTAISNTQSPNGERPYQVNEEAWLPLLDQAVVEAGQRGLHMLVAEVDEVSDELPVLRRAGFVVYTRQDVWVLAGKQTTNSEENKNILRPRHADDDWNIQLLYANTVPRLVQQVEPIPPLHDGSGWVLHEENDLAAFVHVHVGSMATWMRLFIHPSAETDADQIIAAVVRQNPAAADLPIYCCVRRYQSWVQNALERSGFTLWGSQAVMVKHIVQKASKPLPELLAALEAQGISPTAPIIKQYQENGRKKKNGRKKRRQKQPQTQNPILKKS
ncbi:hypothetical protein MNBD_CHLOROFLEXI01-3058 [hydrothermal vent metagenome]|uniref:N-acetyltransferase domain-containing protein n=1 Tax=hydrothermal vent metagenome TaxID=652676 RepID=A0A3B0UVR9_9ZZZZ